MIRNKLLLLILAFCGSLNISFAQQPSPAKYIIITFEDTYKHSQHGTKAYYWIIPQDSINTYESHLSHLYLSGYSSNNLIDCCNGKDVDPGALTQNTSYNFDAEHYKNIHELKQLLARNRREVQTITKKWKSGQKEEIVIFATPVSGTFCSSGFALTGQERSGYKGQIYIPYSSFMYSEEFWKSNKAKFILNQDYSKVKFDIIQL